MKIYLGMDNATQKSTYVVNDNEIVLIQGDFKSFIEKIQTDVIYLPFFILDKYNIAPTQYSYEPEIFIIPENIKDQFNGIAYAFTSFRVNREDIASPKEELNLLFEHFIKKMKTNNLTSVGIWTGFFSKELKESISINSLDQYFTF